MPEQARVELEEIAKSAKKGFNLQDRVKNRGLRRASITIYLDEELGPKLGWAYDKTISDGLTNRIVRVREGVIGELDQARVDLEQLKIGAVAASVTGTASKKKANDLAANVAELEAKRDKMVVELTRTAIVLQLRAVPPIIEKNCRRLAKQTLGITGKNVPDERAEEFTESNTAHLMSKIVQSVTDSESGEINHEFDYDDAIALIGYLPPGQYARLDEKLGILQFTDAISQSIEAQEDFS